jgi:hypothetical protein
LASTLDVTSIEPEVRKESSNMVKMICSLNQIEKNSSKMLFGLVCQNVFGTDCLNDLKEIYYMYLSTDNLAGTELGVLCLKYFYKLTQ